MSNSSKLASNPHLVLVADNLKGGLGAAVMQEAEYFSDRYWQVSIFAPEAKSLQFEFPDLTRSGVNFLDASIPSSVKSMRSGIKAARAILSAVGEFQGKTVVHCHGLRSALFMQVVATTIPTVVTYHGGSVGAMSRRIVMASQARRSKLAVSASPDPPFGFHFWPHASPQLYGTPSLPRRRGLDQHLRIGWFGRLDTPKRPDKWLSALHKAHQLGLPVSGHVVGDGVLLEPLLVRAERLGVPIKAYGPMHADDAVNLMDVLLTWSDSDAITFTMQEAIWRGIPVLTNAIPGPMVILGKCAIGVVDESTITDSLTMLSQPGVYTSTVASQQSALASVIAPGDPLDRYYRILSEWV